MMNEDQVLGLSLRVCNMKRDQAPMWIGKEELCCRNLMARQDLKELGFDRDTSVNAWKSNTSLTDEKQKRKESGYIAGLR